MKALPLVYVLLAFSCGCVPKSHLAKTRADLAESQEKIKSLEQQERSSRSELDEERRALLSARERIRTLEDTLKNAQAQLVAAQATDDRTRKPQAILRPTPPLPGLVRGTYTLLNETVVYSPDAQLKVGRDGVLVSSPTGLMLSDREQTIVGGDLVFETSSGQVQMDDAFLEVNEGDVMVSGKRARVTMLHPAKRAETKK